MLKAGPNQVSRPPCLNFCEQVVLRCIGRINLEQLSDRWRNYVLALGELAKKLSVRYNIETIIAPLDVQISEAIMNFQENSTSISQQVFHACSRPGQVGAVDSMSSMKVQAHNRLGKRTAYEPRLLQASARRQQVAGLQSAKALAVTDSFAPQSPSFDGALVRGRAQGPGGRGSAIAIFPKVSSAFDEHPLQAGKRSPLLIDEIKDYMLSTKLFWNNLPNSVCTSNQTLGPNALRTGRPLLTGQASCFQEPLGLSDMNSDLRYRKEIEQLAGRLDLVLTQIQSALDGDEIDWSSEASMAQQQVLINQRLPAVAVAPLPASRLPASTSTTTTMEPNLEDFDDSSDDFEGSGNGKEPEEGESSDVELPTDLDDEYTDESEMPSSNSQDNTSPTGDGSDVDSNTAPPGDGIDAPPKTPTTTSSQMELPNDIIGVPELSPQRSGAGKSNKLVIHSELHIILLLTVALSIVIYR